MRADRVCIAVCAVVAIACALHVAAIDNDAATRPDWRRSIYNGVDRLARRAASVNTAYDTTPGQTRVSFIPDGMAISWSTVDPYAGDELPTVDYGIAADSLDFRAQAAQAGTTYGTLNFYTVLLRGLGDASRYYYQVQGSTSVGQFKTALKSGDETPFELLVVGDMGLVNSGDTIAAMTTAVNDVDFFLHIGDLSYADDYLRRPGDTYEGSWDAWQDEMVPITSNAPYMSLPGNHEITCDEHDSASCPLNQQNITAYRHRFRMPSAESGGVDSLWYSYDYGMAHFVQIDTETDYPNSPMGTGSQVNAGPFGNQLAWLEADLAAAFVNRADVPWIVVSGHRPWYTSGGRTKEAGDAFEKILLKYDVDVYFSGHVHWYERLWPLVDSVVTQENYDNPKGIVYIVNGAAGDVEGLSTGDLPRRPYSAMIDDTHFGYGKLRVENSTTLRWRYYDAATNSKVDEIHITKKAQDESKKKHHAKKVAPASSTKHHADKKATKPASAKPVGGCMDRASRSRRFEKKAKTCPITAPSCQYLPGQYECCTPGEMCIRNVGCRC